jgi:hypothetical protein
MKKVGMESEPWHVALGLSDFKTHSSDLCQITTFNVGNVPFPEQYRAAYILALGLVGVFPRLDMLHYENGAWGTVEDLIEVCQHMGRFVFEKG